MRQAGELTAALAAGLAERQAGHLYRSRLTVDGAQGPEIRVGGATLLAFCSNDYLGLAADPRLREAVIDGVRRFGVGSGAAHLVNGHSTAHAALEDALAAHVGRPRALLFSTGYMANQGVLSALLGRGDTVFEDRLNHASLIDGGLLSRARLRRYRHGDVARLEDGLTTARGRRLVATDAVFSMDGDIAPLAQLAAACQRHDAWLMADDAHGIGVLGEQGAGTLDALGLDVEQVPILMATLGKALGTFGAFVAGSGDLIETLIQQARSYIYTTASPPALAHATLTALDIARSEDWRRERLTALITRFRREVAGLGLALMPSTTPIQPIVAGEAETALRWSARLRERGMLVTAIRPPTVPVGSARLRVTLSALHEDRHLDRLLDALADLAGSAA